MIEKAKKLSPINNYVYAVWHQNAVPCLLSFWGKPHTVILSQSKDGDLLAYAMKKLSYVPARGSSTRGGKQAKEKLMEMLNRGIPGAITVDGPKGPAKEVKSGIIDIAKKTQAVIVPIIALADDYWTFNSWDKFRLPKLPSRITVTLGEPIHIPPDLEFEDYVKYKEIIKSRINCCEHDALKAIENWNR